MSTPKIIKKTIEDEVLDRLELRCSIPGNAFPEDRILDLWHAVREIKGWMKKKTASRAYRDVAWHQLRTILDCAIANNDHKTFDEFVKAWTELEFRAKANPIKVTRKNHSPNLWKERDAQRINPEAIESLIPLLPCNHPNSPRRLKIIEAIRSLQRRLKRAPTIRELEEKTSLSKNDVYKDIAKLGLSKALSKARNVSSKKAPLRIKS